jgi:hypothetical protein
MQIVFINNDGAGFADKIEIAEGLTIRQLFEQKMPYAKPQNYLIRVNRQATSGDYILQPDDRVSITPTKIEGAGRSVTKGTLWEPVSGSTASFSAARSS